MVSGVRFSAGAPKKKRLSDRQALYSNVTVVWRSIKIWYLRALIIPRARAWYHMFDSLSRGFAKKKPHDFSAVQPSLIGAELTHTINKRMCICKVTYSQQFVKELCKEKTAQLFRPYSFSSFLAFVGLRSDRILTAKPYSIVYVKTSWWSSDRVKNCSVRGAISGSFRTPR